jgi:hypothetical protein
LASGNYSCTIVDDAGCMVIVHEYVQNFTGSFNVDPVVTDDFCSGAQGMITLNISGGSGNYTILWSDLSTSDTLYNLAAGTYGVTVTDTVSVCAYTINNIEVGNSGFFTVSETINHATCPLCNNGSIDLTINGVGSNYTFIWSNGAATEDLTGVVPDNYTVTITDDWGCILVETYTVGYTTGLPGTAGNDKIVLYPNPTEGIFNVRYQFVADRNVHFEIFDAMGRLVKRLNTPSNQGSVTFDMNGNPPGFYILRATNGSGGYNMKVVLR